MNSFRLFVGCIQCGSPASWHIVETNPGESPLQRNSAYYGFSMCTKCIDESKKAVPVVSAEGVRQSDDGDAVRAQSAASHATGQPPATREVPR